MAKLDRREMRMMLLAHDPHCWFCGKRVTVNTSTIDHFEPTSKGGPVRPANYRLCSRVCNSGKADHPIESLVCSLRRGEGVFPLSSESEQPEMKVAGSNYASIEDPKVRKLAQENAVAIKDLLEKTGRYVVEIGKRLLTMKEALEPAEFKAWWKAEFEFRQATAYNYMAVAKKFTGIDGLENVSTSP